MAVSSLSSASGSQSTSVTAAASSGVSPAKSLLTTSAVAVRVLSWYSPQAPPRSGRSTRRRKLGMTLRSSCSMSSA